MFESCQYSHIVACEIDLLAVTSLHFVDTPHVMCLLALLVCLHQEFRHNHCVGVLLLLHIVEVVVSVVVVVFCGGVVSTFVLPSLSQQLGGGCRGGIDINAYI